MRSVERASRALDADEQRRLGGAEISLEHVSVIRVHDARAVGRRGRRGCTAPPPRGRCAPALAMCVWTMCGRKSRRIAEHARERGVVVQRRQLAAQARQVLDGRRGRQQIAHVAFALAQRAVDQPRRRIRGA